MLTSMIFTISNTFFTLLAKSISKMVFPLSYGVRSAPCVVNGLMMLINSFTNIHKLDNLKYYLIPRSRYLLIYSGSKEHCLCLSSRNYMIEVPLLDYCRSRALKYCGKDIKEVIR